MFRKKKKRVGDAGKGVKRLLPVGRFGSRQRFSLSRLSLLVLCRDMVLCVVTWFLGYRRLLGRDRGFPGHDRVVLLLFFYGDRGPHGVATVFCFLS